MTSLSPLKNTSLHYTSLPIKLLTSTADRQLHQMIHKRLQANIVGKDRLCRLAHTTIALCSMRCRRIELGQQETRLRTTSVTDNETRQREAVLDEILGIFFGALKQSSEVLVALLLVVSCLAPLRHCLAVEDEDVEESIEQQDGLVLDRRGVEEDGLAAFVVEAVTVEGGLDHDEGVADILVV